MREFAQLRLALWNDDSMRALPSSAQHLHCILQTSPSLSYCGVADWRPKRIAGRAAGWTPDEVQLAAAWLIDKLFILVDESTEEVLVRTWIRDDELMKQPKMAVAMAKAHASVASRVLRGVIVHELRRLHEDCPKLRGWGSELAAALLDKTSVDPSVYPLGNPLAKGSGYPSLYPSGEGSLNPSDNGSPNPSPNPSGNPPAKGKSKGPTKGSVKAPPTTATTTATYSNSDSLRSSGGASAPNAGRKRPAHPLPDDWEPSEGHRALADEFGLDVDREAFRFRNHAQANDRRQANWTAAFTTWLDKARDFAPAPADDDWRRWSEQ